METLQNLWEVIRANFFYDLRSSIISVCFILGSFFLYKLLKDNGEKVYKSMRYLTCVAMFFSVAMLLYTN